MSRTTSREDGVVSFDYNLMHESTAFMPEDGIIREEVRVCKRIMPKGGKEVHTGRKLDFQIFSAANPRVVSSDFKIPPNWELVDQVQDGEYLGFLQGVGDIYHTCQRARSSYKDWRGYRGTTRVDSPGHIEVVLLSPSD